MDEIIPLAEQAIRLSPRDPFIGNWYFQIGAVHLLQSRTNEAIVWFEKARSANPATSEFTLTSPLPTRSKARLNTRSPSLPKPGGLAATIVS